MSDWPQANTFSEPWELLGEQSLEATAASITFTISNSNYRRFRLLLYALYGATPGTAYVQLNGDSGGNYNRQRVFGDGVTLTALRSTGVTRMELNSSVTAVANGSLFAMLELSKPDATLEAHGFSRCGFEEVTSGDIRLDLIAHEWSNVADLITSILIGTTAGEFQIGTLAVLEGSRFNS